MPTQRARKMLEFIRGNVRNGAESIPEARAFVRRIGALSRMEREFLDMALRGRRNLDELCSRFPPEEGPPKPIRRLPVVMTVACGPARASRAGPRVSVG